MKQQIKKNTGQSALIYNTEFKWSYLKPVYWGTWLAILCLWLIMFLPPVIQDKLANLLGYLARNINKKRRRIARKNIDTCFTDLTDEEKNRCCEIIFDIRRAVCCLLVCSGGHLFACLKKELLFRGRIILMPR